MTSLSCECFDPDLKSLSWLNFTPSPRSAPYMPICRGMSGIFVSLISADGQLQSSVVGSCHSGHG